MHPVARVRYVLARHRWLSWLATASLAAAAGLVTAGAVAGIDEARRSWGTGRTVVVATADLAPGDALAGRTETRSHPAPMVPAAALTSMETGALARQHVGAGEVLVEADVVAGAAPQALIPPGWRGVPLAEAVPSGAAVGDQVAVAGGGTVLADEGVVVATSAERVVVAVPAAEVAPVAAAAATGDVVLVLLP